jgi:uncharacterized protein with von Willebrand factor type A (vWA) domain
MTKEEIAAMIQEAILAERKRICAALRSSRPEYDWDSQNGSKFDWGMSMVSIAEEIEKGGG